MNFALLALVFAIGVIAGLRSMTAPAVVSWAVRLGWIHLNGSRLANMGTGLAVIVLTVLAIGELITDKLRFAPYRTAPGPLIARLVTGAVCAAALAVSAGGSLQLGAALGAFGALTGAFGGYNVRRQLVHGIGLPDFLVALGEDTVAIVGALLIVLRLR